MLLINEDNSAAISNKLIRNWDWVKDLPPIIFPTKPVNPEFLSPWLIIRTKATVITAGCAKPLKASFAGITSRIIRSTRAPAAMASYLNFPHIKKPRRQIIVNERIN
jgi:hypothetical protein